MLYLRPKTCIFLTVRTGSSRLPNKSILNLCGQPTIKYLIDNLKKSKQSNGLVLCTTTNKEDDILCNIANDCNIKYFRGSSDDKLYRWLGACQKFDVDFFANVDGDDLFFDYELADHILLQSKNSAVDFIDGQGYLYNDAYGISHQALKKVCNIKTTEDTEYIKPHFIKANLNIELVKNYNDKWKKGKARMTLDYPEDFTFFETVISAIKPQEISFDNVLKYLHDNPNTVNINYAQEAKWSQNQKRQFKL
tara:strand:+ start:1778 stop:2527 length:750 start_codon:yes stop_codon:yes gene_type:complete